MNKRCSAGETATQRTGHPVGTSETTMKHLLFVDVDDGTKAAIESLRAAHGSEWRIEAADGVATALAALRRTPFDFVFVDVERQRDAGVDLLRETRRMRPKATRVALCGPPGDVASMRAGAVAQQSLAKPCAPRAIEILVENTLRLARALGEEEIREVVGGIATLPTPPRVFLALTEALADPEVSLDLVAKTISEDVGLSTKLLQLVNSSYFGPSRPMSSLRQATSYLGLSRLKQLVLGAEVFGSIADSGYASALELQDQQRHAVIVARFASEVVADPRNCEAAFTVGLLHDLGEVVLAAAGSPRRAPESPTRPHLHARTGAYLAAAWGLPTKVVEALLYHHRPSLGGLVDFDLAGIVHVADAIFGILAAATEEQRRTVRERDVDRQWLQMVGQWERFDEWLDRAADLAREDELLHVTSAA